ncbi:hypothetical protein HYT55_05800 [Candidatus Woesearchaeota archaeon]|nr:hypothetical protein [Candidatus Woesearchaeota archaeon]
MSKKCIICNVEAVYVIKDTSDYYCRECAEEHFGDLAMLVKVEDDVSKLKEIVGARLAPQERAEHEEEHEDYEQSN